MRQAELDGLRAVAVVAVVLFHCQVAGFGNGFYGVDVFFVLSGFLITRLLLREHSQTGGISVSAFWARRIRRIFPTLFVTLVLTIGITRWLAPPWEWEATLAAARAAAMSTSNFHFWSQPGGYFAVSVVHQPLLHTWSLGVEEQFYLVWPVAVLVALRLGGRRAAAWWVALTAIGSLTVSTILSSSSPNAAFYLPHSRVWELATGGAVAFAGPAIGRLLSGSARTVVGWAALAVGVWSLTAGSNWGVPSPGAVVPVMATAALIIAVDTPASGSASGSVGRLLALPPFVLIGRWSYSWYLFHWPAITFVQIALGRHDVLLELLASVGALGLAGLNWRLVERRFATPATSRRHGPQRMIIIGVLTSALLVGGTTALAQLDNTRGSTTSSGLDVISSDAFEPTETTAAPSDARPFDWNGREGLRLLDASRTNVEWPCVNFDFNSVLDERCVALPGERFLVVVGDSHASGAALAVAPIARAANLGLIVVGYPQCPVVGIDVWLGSTLFDGCKEWAMKVIDEIATHPDRFAGVVWTARSDWYFPTASVAACAEGCSLRTSIGTAESEIRDVAIAAEIWQEAIAAMAQQFSDAAIPLVLLHGSPEFDAWPSDCVAARGPAQCAALRDELDRVRLISLAAENAATEGRPLVVSVDPYDHLCDATSCPVVLGRDVLYRDDNHLSPQGALLLTQPILAALRSLQVVDGSVMR